MPYRCNINYLLFQDRSSKLLSDLARQSCTSLFGENTFNKQCDHVFMLVDTTSREPVTQYVMYGEWKRYPPVEAHRLSI